MASLLIGSKASRGGRSASLLCCQIARLGLSTPSCRHMSLHIQTVAAASVGSRATAVTVLSASSTMPKPNPLDHAYTSFASTKIGNVRFFGRKASKMGHHLETLGEMACEGTREEARKRREEKKKKSKKARLSASKDAAAAAADDEGAENDDNVDDTVENADEDGNPTMLPASAAVRSKMLMVIASIERSFSSIRGGEPTPELFDNIRVSAYGETVPLSSVGQVVIEDAQRATISCYDPSVANDVRDAVRDMPGLSLSPYLEEGGSGVVIIPIPRVSEETRKEIVKELGRQAENGRQRIRMIRRNAMDIVKKGKDGKLEGISKDDAFRVGKDVESVTEEVLSLLNVIVEKKQKSVMED